jgi:hypothetical protein
MGRRDRRCTQLLDDLEEMGGYWKLKVEALIALAVERRCGPVIKADFRTKDST